MDQESTYGLRPARQAKSSSPQLLYIQIVVIVSPAYKWYYIWWICLPHNILYCILMRNRTVL